MVLYLSLFGCAVAATVLVVRYDLYEREPPLMLLVAALAGGALMWGIGHVEDWTLSTIGGSDPGAATFAGIAAVEEELARLALVALVAMLVPFHLNDPIDGLIYGSIVGLGMAVEESRMMLDRTAADGWLLPGSEVVRLCGHLVLGGITGFAVGMARFRMPRWPLALGLCLGVSLAIHFLWDWVAFAAAMRGETAPRETLVAVGLMLAGMAAYGALVMTGSRWSRRMFAPGSRHAVWGWPFAGNR